MSMSASSAYLSPRRDLFGKPVKRFYEQDGLLVLDDGEEWIRGRDFAARQPALRTTSDIALAVKWFCRKIPDAAWKNVKHGVKPSKSGIYIHQAYVGAFADFISDETMIEAIGARNMGFAMHHKAKQVLKEAELTTKSAEPELPPVAPTETIGKWLTHMQVMKRTGRVYNTVDNFVRRHNLPRRKRASGTGKNCYEAFWTEENLQRLNDAQTRSRPRSHSASGGDSLTLFRQVAKDFKELRTVNETRLQAAEARAENAERLVIAYAARLERLEAERQALPAPAPRRRFFGLI